MDSDSAVKLAQRAQPHPSDMVFRIDGEEIKCSYYSACWWYAEGDHPRPAWCISEGHIFRTLVVHHENQYTVEVVLKRWVAMGRDACGKGGTFAVTLVNSVTEPRRN